MADDVVLIAQGLARAFGEVVAVDGLSLQVRRGEIFGFLGHNGAGKTTSVRLLNGVLRPDQGHVQVLGLDPTSQGPELRRRTGVLTETPALEERLTARENLLFYAELYGLAPERMTERVEALLEIFNLASRADDRVSGFSKGMKQRLALARALVHEPEILFLDEPTSGLDPVAARAVRRLVARLSREEDRTVILCTHNLIEAQTLCDRVAVLKAGRLMALGRPADLARRWGRNLRLDFEVSGATRGLALSVLRATPGVAELASEDGVISVLGIDRERVPDLVEALVGAGVRLYRVSPREPTLEDIYFALHGLD